MAKALKVAMLAFASGYALYFISYMIWSFVWGAKDPTLEPVPIFLWSIAPGIVAAIIAFVLRLFLIGRKVNQPLSIMKGPNVPDDAD